MLLVEFFDVYTEVFLEVPDIDILDPEGSRLPGPGLHRYTNPNAANLSSRIEPTETLVTSITGKLPVLNEHETELNDSISQYSNNLALLAPKSTLKRKRNVDDDTAAQKKRTRCQTPSRISCMESYCVTPNSSITESYDGAQSRLATWLADQEQEAHEPLDTGMADYALEPCRSVEQSIIMTSIEAPRSTWAEQEPEQIIEDDDNSDQTETSCSGTWDDVDSADDAAFFQSKRDQSTTGTSIQQSSESASRKTRG